MQRQSRCKAGTEPARVLSRVLACTHAHVGGGGRLRSQRTLGGMVFSALPLYASYLDGSITRKARAAACCGLSSRRAPRTRTKRRPPAQTRSTRCAWPASWQRESRRRTPARVVADWGRAAAAAVAGAPGARAATATQEAAVGRVVARRTRAPRVPPARPPAPAATAAARACARARQRQQKGESQRNSSRR